MADKEGNITPPNWNPREVLDHPRPLPDFARPLPDSKDADKIPTHDEIKPFAGLPASKGPRSMKIETGQVTGTN